MVFMAGWTSSIKKCRQLCLAKNIGKTGYLLPAVSITKNKYQVRISEESFLHELKKTVLILPTIPTCRTP